MPRQKTNLTVKDFAAGAAGVMVAGALFYGYLETQHAVDNSTASLFFQDVGKLIRRL